MSFFQTNFENNVIPSFLSWKVGPKPDKFEAINKKLIVEPNFGTDFWRNTYYHDPVLQNYNGHVLGLEMEEQMFVAETRFTFRPSVKYDQAGIYLGCGQDTWLKAGVEYVDGKAWQSVVVTRGDYSDWSKAKQPWPEGMDVCLKVYRQGCSYVVEVSEDDGKTYDFVRIAHLPTKGSVTVGLMICRPLTAEEAGKSEPNRVEFHHFNVLENKGYHH